MKISLTKEDVESVLLRAGFITPDYKVTNVLRNVNSVKNIVTIELEMKKK